MKDRGEALGEVAWDVLRRIVRERLARNPGAHLLDPELRSLDLRLSVAPDGAGDPRRFAERLIRSIDEQIDDLVQAAAVFRPGQAYCHRCRDGLCEHSSPPSARHVFAGYAQTGTPRWTDMAQLCLDLKHPDVDKLYETPPAFLTLVFSKSELHGGLLDAFRDGRCDLLGQVTAGFFSVRARAEEGRGVLALTFQAAASRARRGKARLGLNILGRAPSGDDLTSLWDRQDDLPWRKPVAWAQRALRSIPASQLHEAGAGRLEERVQSILQGLARRLTRERRARGRRTRHAEQRHTSGERPTRKAVDDARDAKPESCLVDERRGTLVILGDRGRTHFFSPQGQLVSSVRYSRDAITRKIQLELWRSATSEELESLQSNLPD
jgi:hypothetical protein